MRRLDEETVNDHVCRVVERVPCRSLVDVQRFIAARPAVTQLIPKPDIIAGNNWFCTRSYTEAIVGDRLLEVYVGSNAVGNDHIGCVRLDPRWLDAEGRDRKRWELTRAYIKPPYRGLNYSALLCEIAVRLARRCRAHAIVAYPRHVAMLVTLLDRGFVSVAGPGEDVLRRIVREGRVWYAGDPVQRRLYYATEFRPSLQHGGLLLEKKLGPAGLWEYLGARNSRNQWSAP